MAQLLDSGLFSLVGTNSALGVGYTLTFYVKDTSTLTNTYPTEADAGAGTNANANPITIGADGRLPPIWVNAQVKSVLKDAAGVTLETLNPVNDYPIGSITAASRTALAAIVPSAGLVAYLSESGRSGWFTCKAGAAPSDAAQGLYVASATSGFYWERQWDGVNGRPEWFGAVGTAHGLPIGSNDNRAAFDACVALCPVVQFGDYNYTITDVWKMTTTGRVIQGVAGAGSTIGYSTDPANPMGYDGGTRIILVGANVVSATVAVLGRDTHPAGDTLLQMRNTTVRDITFARDCSVYRCRASLSTNSIDCVKGVIIAGSSDCLFERLKSQDSPVGFHVFDTIFSYIRGCNVHRTTPASTPTNDFFVGYLVGGYTANAYGLGANSSVYLIDCSVFDKDAAFSTSIGLRLFGLFVDTFIRGFEQARLTIGLEIDGRDASGVVEAVGGGSHQDVCLIDCVLDYNSAQGLYIHDTNDSLQLDISNLYVGVQAGQNAVQLNNVAGSVNITNGRWLAGGLVATDVNGLKVFGTAIRDASVPVKLTNCGMANIQPEIFALSTACAKAVESVGSYRSYLAPIVRGAPGKVTYGIVCDAATDRCEVHGSMIDVGCLVGTTAASKVRYNGADATTGFSTNVLVGVTT